MHLSLLHIALLKCPHVQIAFFEIHQLCQSGFSKVYSNCCCSCSFEAGIMKIVQSSHKRYSNNILNFQESTTILNACTKKSGNLLNTPHIYIYIYIYIYIIVRVCVFVSIYICMYICISVRVCLYLNIYICMCVYLYYMHVYLYIYMCISVCECFECLCVYISVYVCVYIYINKYLHRYINIFIKKIFCICNNMYIYTSVCVCVCARMCVYIYLF